ncbi:MAG: hypothetical protein KF900_00525 [Bacteroidetes bacterium]|nr:hypothetical protein [Bacteroidota bacterium]
MLTNYFTEEEKRRWDSNNSEKLGINFAEKFMAHYNVQNTSSILPVHIFDNPEKYTEAILSYPESLSSMPVIEKWRYGIFANSFANCLISNLNKLGLNVSQIHLACEGHVFVLRKPIKEYKNQFGKYHNIHDAAVVWADGQKKYFLHGVEFTEKMFTKLQNKTYSFKDFVKEKNEEIKSLILKFIEEKHGSEYAFNFIRDNMQEMATYVHETPGEYLRGTTWGMNIGVYTLFKGSIRHYRKYLNLAFVRCYCPSSDRMFFLAVHPSHISAKDAIASLYRIPRKLAYEIKYIQRQGERFSTVFTETGKSIVEKLNEKDLKDLVSISGEDYFNLMRYEY